MSIQLPYSADDLPPTNPLVFEVTPSPPLNQGPSLQRRLQEISIKLSNPGERGNITIKTRVIGLHMQCRDLAILQFESIPLASGTPKDRSTIEC